MAQLKSLASCGAFFDLSGDVIGIRRHIYLGFGFVGAWRFLFERESAFLVLSGGLPATVGYKLSA